MKKVSVFTVLTCFLAGTAHFPCYAGPFMSKPVDPVDDGRSKGVPAQQPKGGPSLVKTDKAAADDPSRRLAAQPKQPSSGGIPSAHPKPKPSEPFFDPEVSDLRSGDLDPDLLSKTPSTFDPPSDSQGPSTAKPPIDSSFQLGQQIADSVREALGPNAQHVTINVQVNPPPSDQSLSSLPPPILPAPLPEKFLEHSHEVLSGDRSSLPAQVSSQIPSMHPISYPPVQGSSQIPSMQPTPYPPHGDQQTTLPILSSSKDHEDVIQVTRPVSGWALTLPTTLKPISIPNSRGQLVRLPKVLDLSIYAALSDVTHSDFKVINSQASLPDSKKSMGFNLINTYLESYGKKFGQDTTAIANCLKQAVESSNGRPVSFKVCQNKETRTALFMLHVEGGAVIIGRVPGQDF